MRIFQNLLRTKYNSIINNYFASNANKSYKTKSNKNKRAFQIMKRDYHSNQNIEPPNNRTPITLFIILICSFTIWQSRKPPAEPTPVIPWLINLSVH